LDIKTLRFGDDGQIATAELIGRLAGFRTRALSCSPALSIRLERMRRGLDTLASLDRQYGGSMPVRLEGTEELVAAILTDLAHVDAEALRARDEALVSESSHFILGVGLWAIRHDVPLPVVEPVVNALARRSNGARTKSELAAVYGLTQGLIAHVAPLLSADLERSNPERPWRILHANLAVVAIRTEDGELMDHAFDALDAALPDERAGFYAQALALALAPGVAAPVRERIGARHLKWTATP
jgi:hypothetical protein